MSVVVAVADGTACDKVDCAETRISSTCTAEEIVGHDGGRL
jgi:hypothetical protein